MDGWETRLRIERKKVSNPPQYIRRRMERNRTTGLINKAFWPIEDDLVELEPISLLNYEEIEKPEFYPYQSTLYEFIKLRRDLLLGISIVDSSGRRRPGPEVWERLKQAFPRLVRAMFLHLKRMSKEQQMKVSLPFETSNVHDRSASREITSSRDEKLSVA